jgi:p-aminobenzoyl-glutamate transporter AbgT
MNVTVHISIPTWVLASAITFVLTLVGVYVVEKILIQYLFPPMNI